MTKPEEPNRPPGENVDPDFHRKMTFAEHLDELRVRLIRSTVVVAGLFALCMAFNDRVADLVLRPFYVAREHLGAAGKDLKLSYIEPTEGFFFYMNAALFGALLLGMPYALFQMWQFVAAGLYPKEKRWVTRLLPISLALFLAGSMFSYFWLLPIALEYLLSVGNPDVMVAGLRPEAYFGFFLMMCVLLGVVFQLPLVQIVLARVGILSVEIQKKYRRHFILGAVVAAAILTPTGDAITLTCVAVPMIILFEVGLLFAKTKPRATNATGSA